MKQYLNAVDVAGIMECSVNHAYKVIRGLNDELKAQGYITRSGRIPAKYFYERAGLGDLQELDLNNPPDERTCKQIYGFEIGNPGIAEKVMQMYEEAGLWYIRTLYGAYLEDQHAKERKTALEVSEWYHEELKKKKEYEKRWTEKRTRELLANQIRNT